MAVYPGNSALSTAVKDRVLSTFQQTVTLFKQGRTEEVVQGCGLILRMDPLFDPAKKLMEKARNPAAPIDVDTLIAADPIVEARSAMQARNFQKVVDVTTEILTNDLMNEEARVLNEQAREKLEAAPFVDQFVRKAEQAIATGDAQSAKASLDKLKTLDADDTAISRLETGIKSIKPAGAPSASSSFIVDTPAAGGGRNSAQASDFGFTFEEEKAAAPPQSFSFDSPFSTDTGTVPSITPPANFSFDGPAAPPKAPQPQAPPSTPFSFDTPPPSPSPFSPPGGTASAEFDFTTASVETSPDDQKKVQGYLADGDRAFDSGQFQQAIDLWSRIFLIDVTNEQASERIEKAKLRRRDIDQKGDALLATGIQAFDRGDHNAARETFGKLLQLDPQNPTAKEYLEKLTEVGTEGGAAGFAASYIAPKPSAASPPPSDIWSEDAVTSDASLIPPSAPAAARRPPSAKAAAKPAPAPASTSGLPMKAIVIVLVLAVLAAGGWFAWSKFMAKPAVDTAATESIFNSANSLSQKGQYDAAIALLQDVKPSDPQHDKALSMIADLQAKKSQATEQVNGRPTEAVFRESLANGKSAFDARDYDAAKKAFDTAARIKPLPPDMKALYDTAAQQVGKLEGAKALFNSQRYQDALTNLQSLAQQDPQNQSIRRMIADSHFNLGAIALQEERLPDAAREFDDVLKTDATDELAKRSKLLAARYDGQPKDLLYRIYVKYLPMRKAM
ncbi:MAG: tetratricopeptide repeat protein [Acidobacteriota bacterium]|nr:tetratricopeptide repeat protein [Acidobacteriota bacterium]